MSELHKFQTEFKNHLFGTSSDLTLNLVKHKFVNAEQQLQVYRNNVFVSFRESLKSVYPATFEMVGEDFFYQVARQYLTNHPSISGDIHQFGHQFPDYLQSLQSLEQYPYLADLAKLEWLYHETFHERDTERFDMKKLESVESDEYGNITFILNPASRLFQSNYPVIELWQSTKGECPIEDIDLSAKPHWILVLRPKLDTQFYHLDEAEFVFLNTISNHQNLSTSLEKASEIDSAIDIQHILLKHIQAGTIVDIQ